MSEICQNGLKSLVDFSDVTYGILQVDVNSDLFRHAATHQYVF